MSSSPIVIPATGRIMMISPKPSTTVILQQRASEDGATTATSRRESVEGPSTLFDNPERVGAVPTRIVKPSSTESSFTCYAFSEDGERFVTGETDGSIRLWDTSSYETVGTYTAVDGAPILAVSFFEQSSNELVSFDKLGYVRILVLDVSTEQRTTSIPERATILNMRKIRCEDSESNLSNFLRNQFSKDGKILVHFRGMSDPTMNCFTFTSADIYKIGENLHEGLNVPIPAHAAGFEFSVPVLSKNGRNLLICSCRSGEDTFISGVRCETYQTDITVMKIDPGAGNHETVQLNGQHASWGLDGEYLLVWSWYRARPLLLIYKTEDIERKGREAIPFAERTLDLGLFDYKAQVLKPQEDEESVKVLIYEGTEHKQKRLQRFFIWDTKHDTVPSEVQMSMHQAMITDKVDRIMAKSNPIPQIPIRGTMMRRTRKQLMESGFLIGSAEEFYCRLVGNVFPKFCASKDKNWVGAFFSRQHSGGICSMKNEVTVWKFRLPESVKVDPFLLPSHVMFDPQENHFVVFSHSGIFACHPDFLRLNDASAMITTDVQRPVGLGHPDRAEDADYLENCGALSCAALMRKQSLKLELLDKRQNSFRQRQNLKTFKRIVDVFKSADGSLTGLIAEDTDHEAPTVVSISEVGLELKLEEGHYCRFPRQLGSMDEPFNPARIFLFDDAASAEGKVVLISDRQKPVVVFSNHQLEDLTPVDLDISSCLDVCMTEDCKQLLVLGTSGVHFLDLKRQAIRHYVQYKVDFDRIGADLPEAMYWRRMNVDGEQEAHTERRISDNGDVVLLGWDAKNHRSITVKPTTEQGECDVLVQQADGRLSDYCALSAFGASTSFFDVNDLALGKITLGIFNERLKKVVLRFHITEALPLTLSAEQEGRVLSSVLYGLSKDESELISVTMGLHQIFPYPNQIEDKIRVFDVYKASDHIPTYDRLTLRRASSIKETFRKLHAKHGVSVFSTPSADGMTIFQKAFLRNDKEMVELIKGFAEEHETLLAVEWTSPYPDETAGDLLGEALRTRTRVKEAVELVSSPLVPFGSAANVIKKHFHALVVNHQDVLEEALKENRFVTPVCDLDVHVKFMDHKRKSDSGVYMDTTNTFLNWMHVKNQRAMEKNWRYRNESTVRYMENDGNKSTTPASLKFVRIKDAAKTGMNGILRPLLLKQVPVEFYEFDVVKWVVLLKWFKIWKQRFLWQLAWYMAFLACFASYAIMLSRTDELSTTSEWKKISLSCLLGVTVPFCLLMLIEECQQSITYIRDGEKHLELRKCGEGKSRKGKLSGFLYYIRREWNLMDLASCALILLFIVPLHIHALSNKEAEDWLSAFVAIESIVAFAKVWYFAQPFQHTGPLVQMIYCIVWESAIFLGLAFEVMLGFGVGLPTLFRNPTPDDAGHDGTEDGNEAVEDAFGHFHFSLYTLFFALVGNFNPEVYRSAGNLSWLATLIFIIYLLAQMILLLNLLISIMGDTFARVKDTEEAHLLMGRAKFIDACEADLGEAGCKRIDEEIDKYLHVLTEIHQQSEESSTTELPRDFQKIGNNCKEIVAASETNIKTTIQSQVKSISEQITSLRESLVQCRTEDTEVMPHLSGRVEVLAERLTAVENVVKRTSDRMEEVFDQTSEKIDKLFDLITNMTRQEPSASGD